MSLSPLLCRASITWKTYYQLRSQEHISVELYSKSKHFYSMKCIWKCRLQNGNHCIQAWVCWPLLIVFTFLKWINKSWEFSADHCTHDLLQRKRNIYLPYRADTTYCLIDFTFVLVMPFHSHYSDATWASWRLESPATGLLRQQDRKCQI